MKARTVERITHPFWDILVTHCYIAPLEGLLIGATDDTFQQAYEEREYSLPLNGIEAFELTGYESLQDVWNYYDQTAWRIKQLFCHQLSAPLSIIVFQEGNYREFQLVREPHMRVIQQSTMNEVQFLAWWKRRKALTQVKPTNEARRGQSNTHFDQVLEENGTAWGGNIDGILMSTSGQVAAIIEVRNTTHSLVSAYDPNQFFQGTSRRPANDFKTWLSVKYPADALGVPLYLLTFSRRLVGNGTEMESRCGFAKVARVARQGLTYVDRPPNLNLFNSPERLIMFLEADLGVQLSR